MKFVLISILRIFGWLFLFGAVACMSEEPLPALPAKSPSLTEHSPDFTPISTPTLVNGESVWNIYDPAPEHLWNRLFHLLYGRKTPKGAEYGRDSLDPLYWAETTYLLEGPSHEQAIQLLDEFLATNGETLIADPLKRAMFQRDLWAIFDWLAFRLEFNPIDYLAQCQALQERIVEIIRRVALTEEEILALPDNYLLAVQSQGFPEQFSEQTPETAFLPPDLLTTTGAWILMGREGGPMAASHLTYPFSGRSTFLVFLHVPGEGQATLDYFTALQEADSLSLAPLPPSGTEVALVRQMMLIDQSGKIVFSPLIESIQMRHFTEIQGQMFYEFLLNRDLLFTNVTGGFRALDSDDRGFSLFFSHGVDWFEFDPEDFEHGRPVTLQTCRSCHLGNGANGVQTILSYSRFRFDLPNQQKVALEMTTPENEAKLVIDWKMKQRSWQELQNFFR